MNIGFGLLNFEKEEGWLTVAFAGLMILFVVGGLDEPQLVITDEERALKSAPLNVFPGAAMRLPNQP